MERFYFLTVLFMAAVIAFAFNGSLAITDPVECNYSLSAKEMFLAGNLMSPVIFGNPWYDKPIFLLWELTSAFTLFGINEFAVRFFPAVFSVLSTVLIYFFARRIYNVKTALYAAAIFVTCFSYFYLSKAVITDMSLFFFQSAVLVFFFLGYREQKRKRYYLCFFFAGLGVLTKGPVAFLLPGLLLAVFLILRGDAKELLRLKWGGGLLILAAVCATWYYPMYKAHGDDFITGFLGVHNFLRATVSEHPRDDVWYYYMFIFLAGFFPWSFVMLYRAWKERGKLTLARLRKAETLFLVVWALGTIAVYQSFATKYPTYTFPSIFPFAILLARMLQNVSETKMKQSVMVLFALYFVLIPTLMRPMVYEHSGKPIGEMLKTLPEDAFIGFFPGSYSTSSVFYSGRTVYQLAEKDVIPTLLPTAGGWNVKNVMPFYALEELPQKDLYIIVDVCYPTPMDTYFSLYDAEPLMEHDRMRLLKLTLKAEAAQ